MDEKKKSLLESLESSAELFEAGRVDYDNRAEKFWTNLSYEDKLYAFHSVCKRIHKGDIVDKGSYRYVLYQVFGFDMDSYLIGMDCGYMDIHNYIEVPGDNSTEDNVWDGYTKKE